MGRTELEQAFLDVYRNQFGNTLKEIAVVLVNLRTVAVGSRSTAASARPAVPPSNATPQPIGRRRAHFGRWHDTPVYQREDLLPGMALEGPAIIEQSDTTTVVEPDMALVVDAHSNLLVKVK
jgi:N-methylhydantoinase A